MQTFDEIVFQNLRQVVKLSVEVDQRPLDEVSYRLPVKFKHLRRWRKKKS